MGRNQRLPSLPSVTAVACAVALLLASAGGCQLAPACKVSAECAGSETCFDKRCRARCSAAADCSNGASCVQGACVFLGATCNGGDDCLSFESCLDGRCQMVCREDEDCRDDMACVNGGCALRTDGGRADTRADAADDSGARDHGSDAARRDGGRLDAGRRDQQGFDSGTGHDLDNGRDDTGSRDRPGADLGPCPGQEVNACGGCGELNGQPGTICGACGLVACKSSDEVSCEDPGYNVCGGCEQLAGAPGAPCGVCGTYRCDQGALLCDDPGKTTFYYDHDGDGFGGQESDDLCVAAGYYRAIRSGDCDDNRSDVNPGMSELCDGNDNDCDQHPEANGSGVCRIWVASANSQTWQARPILVVSGGHMPAPDAVFEAAFAVEGTNKLWALTHDSYHVLDVETMSWVGSGLRGTLFSAAANVTLQQAYGVPTAWGVPDAHAAVTLADGGTAWIYDYDSQYDTFTWTDTRLFGWSGEYAPDPATLSDVWIDVYNSYNWAPAGSPYDICGAGAYSIGPYFGALAGTMLHFNETGWCFAWYYQVAASDWLVFTWARAPAPEYVEALDWINGKLIVFAR